MIATPAPGKPLELVLPPAQALRGRVTVGGTGPTGAPGSIRVPAAYEGQGRLNGACSVQTTARADGACELAGLTPGRYRVRTAPPRGACASPGPTGEGARAVTEALPAERRTPPSV